MKNFKAPKVQTGFVRLSSLSGAPLWRGGKGGRRAKTLVLVWTFGALKFRHQETTRRLPPPMVVYGTAAFAAFPPLRGILKTPLGRFLAPRAYPAFSLIMVVLG